MLSRGHFPFSVAFTRPLAPTLAIGTLLIATLLIAACGGGGSDANSWSAQRIAESTQGSELVPQRVGSVPGVGPNRVAFALFAEDGSLVHGARATVRLYRLDGTGNGRTGTLVGEYELRAVSIEERTDHEHSDGTTHGHEDTLATLYVTNAELDTAGSWGAELDVTTADGTRLTGLRTDFIVGDRSTEPQIGEAVPRSEQLTLRDVADISEVSTATPPNPEMHQITVAAALDTGRPVVIAFATPAFCQTRFCGPMIDAVMRPLAEQFAGQVEFIHIEPFFLDEQRYGKFVPVPALAEWGLRSEPWLMVVDSDGLLAAKFEGVTDPAEIAPVLEGLLAAP